MVKSSRRLQNTKSFFLLFSCYEPTEGGVVVGEGYQRGGGGAPASNRRTTTKSCDLHLGITLISRVWILGPCDLTDWNFGWKY